MSTIITIISENKQKKHSLIFSVTKIFQLIDWQFVAYAHICREKSFLDYGLVQILFFPLDRH